VAAIDGYFATGRLGKGPGGQRENAAAQEDSLFKLNLWQGRTLWGMMLRPVREVAAEGRLLVGRRPRIVVEGFVEGVAVE
jgi:hypothetical protein